jgi:hypothetical protein
MKTYVIATAILTIARGWIGMLLRHDIAYAIGFSIGALSQGLIAAAVYWSMKGRRHQDGKAKTARVMWWAFIAPLVLQSLSKNTL